MVCGLKVGAHTRKTLPLPWQIELLWCQVSFFYDKCDSFYDFNSPSLRAEPQEDIYILRSGPLSLMGPSRPEHGPNIKNTR